ncbi:MAG: hypothetical protein ABFS45_13775 [Pseudomonadota bacterium]
MISYLVDENMVMAMPTYALRESAANSNRQPSEDRDYVVRCVARGPWPECPAGRLPAPGCFTGGVVPIPVTEGFGLRPVR